MSVTHNYGKYPRTGPNYDQWGEQPGLIYDYARDAYFVDRDQYEETYRDQLPEPEPEPSSPGLGEVLLPVAAGAAAIEIGKNAIGGKGYLQQGYELLTDGLGSGAGEQLTGEALDQAIAQGVDAQVSQAAGPYGSDIALGSESGGYGSVEGIRGEGGWDSGFSGGEGTGNVDPLTGQTYGFSDNSAIAGMQAAGLAYGTYKGLDYATNADHSVGRAAYEGALTGISSAGVTGVYGPLVGAYFGVVGSLANDIERIHTPESMLSSPVLRQMVPELDQMTQQQQIETVSALMNSGLLQGFGTTGDKRADLTDEDHLKRLEDARQRKEEGGYALEFDMPSIVSADVNRKRDFKGDDEASGRDKRERAEHNARADAIYQRLVAAGYDVPMVKAWGSNESIPDNAAIINSLSLRERAELAPEFYGNYEGLPVVLSGIDQIVQSNKAQGVQGEPPPPIDSGQRDEEGNPIMRQPEWTPGTQNFGVGFTSTKDVEYAAGGPPILNPEDLPAGAREQYRDTPEQAAQASQQAPGTQNGGLIEYQGEQPMDFKSREEAGAYRMGQAQQPQTQAIQRPLTSSNSQSGTLEQRMPGAQQLPNTVGQFAPGQTFTPEQIHQAFQNPMWQEGANLDPGFNMTPNLTPERWEEMQRQSAESQKQFPSAYQPMQPPFGPGTIAHAMETGQYVTRPEPRTSTLSPGIGLDGKPIQYNRGLY